MTGIYKITNPKGAVYIGQSRNIEERFKQYRLGKCKSQVKLYNSLNKYGFENHKLTIIHQLPDDIDRASLNNLECAYINQYKCLSFSMLNLRAGGGGGEFSQETLEKMRLSAQKRVHVPHSQETKEKMSNSKRGKVFGPETIEKMRQAQIGNKKDNAFKERRRSYMMGRRISAGKILSEGQKLAVSLRHRGEGTHLSKLTTEDVVDIKKLLGNGWSIKQINEKYPKVNKYNLYHIKNGLTWKHV